MRIWVSLKKHVAPTYRYRACARQRLLVRRRRIYDLQKIIHEQLHETNRVRLEVEVWLFLTYFPPHKENSKVSHPAAPTRISVLITCLINNSYPPYPLTTHSGYIPSHLTLAVRRSHIFSCRKAEDTILKERC